MSIPCHNPYNFGDYVKYFWAYQDGAATPNMATNPTGGSGTPSSASTPSSAYWFFVDDVANAGNEMKFTVAASDVRTYSSSSTAVTYDRQMTYYENSKEYVFEFDTANCGTGSSSCFLRHMLVPLTPTGKSSGPPV